LSAARTASAIASVLAAASLALACGEGAAAPAGTDGGAAKGALVTAAPGGDCVTCHIEEYEHVKEPPHVDVKPTTCGVCHVQASWRPAGLHHDWWPLTGAHKGRPDTQCAWCHKGKPSVFKGTPKECVGCHQEDYDASTFPEHQTFPKKCADCHSTDAWHPAKAPPPRAPAPVAAPLPPSKTTPASKTVKTTPATRPPTAQVPAPTPVPVPRPTTTPTTRPPDVISRPSRR
jgi:hypothetical protein